jgi:hypothetical protein
MPPTKNSFVRTLIRALSTLLQRSLSSALVLSDIVKRRSIRVPRAAVKPQLARFLQTFPGMQIAGGVHVGKA